MRVHSLFSILFSILNQVCLFLILVKLFPIDFDFEDEDIFGKILYEVNESVQAHLAQTVRFKDHSVFLLRKLAPDLAAPDLKFVEQVRQSIVTELKWNF